MIDSLVALLRTNNLEPDAFVPGDADQRIFRGEVAAGKVMQTWMNLAKGAMETKYWPIIRGDPDDLHEQTGRDPAAILAAAPLGNIREILRPRFEERRESLAQMLPEVAEAADMERLAAMADASGVYSFIGRKRKEEQWPAEGTEPTRVSLHTLKGRKGKPSVLLLIRVEHSSDVAAYLGFGGWNECPEPELHIAVLREWRNEHRAVPACITNDVLECVVMNRRQTEAAAMKLAAEQWIYCDDIVGQGTQSVRKLAMEIWRKPSWFFWWD
jgi:hypothetical protein